MVLLAKMIMTGYCSHKIIIALYNSSMDYRQSREYGKYMKLLGWETEKLSTCQAYVKKLGPVSLIKIQRPDNFDPKEILDLHRRRRSLHTRIDLLSEVKNLHRAEPHLPSRQLFIDLSKPEVELLRDMNYERRRSLEKANKNGLSLEVVHSNDLNLLNLLNSFVFFWQKEAKIRGDWFYNTREVPAVFQAFSPNAYLINVYKKGVKTPLSSALFISSTDTFIYLFAATTNEGRFWYASTYLLWQAILFAKKLGFKKFDMGSLYDKRVPEMWKSWQGFSHFKKGFGGYEVEYPTYCLRLGLPL